MRGFETAGAGSHPIQASPAALGVSFGPTDQVGVKAGVTTAGGVEEVVILVGGADEEEAGLEVGIEEEEERVRDVDEVARAVPDVLLYLPCEVLAGLLAPVSSGMLLKGWVL